MFLPYPYASSLRDSLPLSFLLLQSLGVWPKRACRMVAHNLALVRMRWTDRLQADKFDDPEPASMQY